MRTFLATLIILSTIMYTIMPAAADGFYFRFGDAEFGVRGEEAPSYEEYSEEPRPRYRRERPRRTYTPPRWVNKSDYELGTGRSCRGAIRYHMNEDGEAVFECIP